MPDKCPTICVVDDDPSVCRALGRVIRMAGFTVRSYTSARELLDVRQLENIDLFLLDIQMPVMNGFILQDRLADTGFKIPFIFMTAHDVEAMRIRSNKKGAAAFLQKPFDENDLLEAINKGLKKG